MDSEEAVNNAEDVADANTYEALSRCQDPPPPNSTTQAPSAPLPPPSSHPDATDHPDYSVAAVTGLMAGCETPVLIVDSFPSGSAGAPIADGSPNCMGPGSAQELPRHNIWAPFRSQQDWEIARWAKRHGTTSSAVTELLAIPEVCIPDESCFRSAYKSYKVVEKLGLSYGNAKELNGIIDQLPGRPTFKQKAVIVCDESVELYYREIIPCIRSLFGDPAFAHKLIFVPERHYLDASRTCRIFNEMHTGNWWWSVQVRT